MSFPFGPPSQLLEVNPFDCRLQPRSTSTNLSGPCPSAASEPQSSSLPRDFVPLSQALDVRFQKTFLGESTGNETPSSEDMQWRSMDSFSSNRKPLSIGGDTFVSPASDSRDSHLSVSLSSNDNRPPPEPGEMGSSRSANMISPKVHPNILKPSCSQQQVNGFGFQTRPVQLGPRSSIAMSPYGIGGSPWINNTLFPNSSFGKFPPVHALSSSSSRFASPSDSLPLSPHTSFAPRLSDLARIAISSSSSPVASSPRLSETRVLKRSVSQKDLEFNDESSNSYGKLSTSKGEKRSRGSGGDEDVHVGPWTAEEHSRFVEGLRLFGRGSWVTISKFIGTRTRMQVASHAQKYFVKLNQSSEKSE